MKDEPDRLRKLIKSAKAQEPAQEPEPTEEPTQGTPEEYNDEPSPALDPAVYEDLTAEEKANIEAEVRLQVAEELRAQRKKQFKKEMLAQYRSLTKPGEEIVPVCLDLPGHANDVRLDGKVFFHGVTYRVTVNVYRTLIDIQARAWEHENEIGGANRDLYRGRKPVERVVTPGTVAQGNTGNNNRLAPMVRF